MVTGKKKSPLFQSLERVKGKKGGVCFDASLISFAGVCLFLGPANREGFIKERTYRLSRL